MNLLNQTISQMKNFKKNVDSTIGKTITAEDRETDLVWDNFFYHIFFHIKFIIFRSEMADNENEDLTNVEFETSDDVEVIPTFDQMRLREDLLRGVYAYGFEKPTAIQQRAIKPITKGRDVIAQAQSGTGKTGTFAISALQLVDTSIRETQALILGPTRELAQQMQKVILALGDYMNIQSRSN